MQSEIFKQQRPSHIAIGGIYFWTATINKWQRLLSKDEYKNVVIDSLEHLSNAGKIDVFAFVVMPNHIHLIWKINKSDGKESPHGSFLKYTAHVFRKMLHKENIGFLENYLVHASNKKYEFWQRDSLAIPLFTREVAFQKLDYLHTNPLAERWNLSQDPCDYKYSSAAYYERDVENYSFIKDLRDEF